MKLPETGFSDEPAREYYHGKTRKDKIDCACRNDEGRDEYDQDGDDQPFVAKEFLQLHFFAYVIPSDYGADPKAIETGGSKGIIDPKSEVFIRCRKINDSTKDDSEKDQTDK